MTRGSTRRTISNPVRPLAFGALTFATILAAGATSLHAQVVPATDGRALSLEEALALVDERSEAVQIATAGVTRAGGQLRQARSQLFPQLSATVSYQRTLQSQFKEIAESAGDDGGGGDGGGDGGEDPADNPLARIFASENTVVLGLQLDQTLFSGGRIDAQRRAATMGREVARIGVSSAVAQARLDVTQAYYDALLAARLVTIAESSLVQTERAFRQTRLARQVGTTAEFDLLRAQVTRDNQFPLVIQARTQRDAAMLRLQQLLELPEEEPLRLTTGLEEGVAETARATLAALGTDTTAFTGRVDAPVDVELLLARRSYAPELVGDALAAADTVTRDRAPVRQAELGVRVQEQLLRAQRAQRLPSIGLTSTYQRFAYPVGGVPGFDEYFPDWTVGIGVRLPLVTGGRIGGQIQEAEAGLVEAKARLRQAEELARLDAQLIVRQLEEAAAAYAASAGTAEQAARAYTIAEVRYREGISTQVELDDARLLQQQALANRARAARDLNVARARLELLGDLPLGAAQGGASGGAGAGAPSPSGASTRSASQTTSPAGASGGFTQSGSPEA